MRIINPFIVLLFSIISCHNSSHRMIEKKELLDTIQPEYKIANNSPCFDISKGYFKKFGIVISNFYEVTKILSIDLNNDKKMDSLIILTPNSLIPDAEKGGVCYRKDTIENRLLIKILNLDNKRELSIFKNVISNNSSAAWDGSEDIKITKNGFELIGRRGQGCVFEYNIYILNNKNRLYVDSIKFYSSCSDKKEFKINYNKPLLLESFNKEIIDSIKTKEDL